MEMEYTVLEEAAMAIQERWPDTQPDVGLILGSGWSDVVDALEVKDSLNYASVPGLGRPGVAGHAGRLVIAEIHGLELMIFQGRRHFYEGDGWTPVALPVYVLKSMGTKTVLLTNAAGGTRGGMQPGDLMVLRDHINGMGTNPLIGEHHSCWGPRFPDQTNVYDPELRALLLKAGESQGESMTEGVYLAGSGPTYETPAEIKAFMTLGVDAVGMSTVPEAQLAHASGMRVAALSCITNLAAGIGDENLSHEEVTDTTRASMDRMTSVLMAYIEELSRVAL